MSPSTASLTAAIKSGARGLGFAGVGILPVGPSLTHPFYERWLSAGFAGEMGYLHRHSEQKSDPARLAPWARSLIVLALNYQRPWPEARGEPTPRGRVSRYAWGADYHEIVAEKLQRLARLIEARAGVTLRFRHGVDAVPLMEREFAARAGLGWVGRHGNLIHWRQGSWLFLAEMLVDLDLAHDRPAAPRPGAPGRPRPTALPTAGAPAPAGLELRESCGSCTACIAACPTQAIVADKTVDARRCISYLTIELKGPIPLEFRAGVGNWVFGCDICQDVCPWNRKAPRAERQTFGDVPPEQAQPSLPALLALDEAQFRKRFGGTPLARPKRRGLLRNAAIALGNQLATGDAQPGVAEEQALEALKRALGDPEPLIRGAAAWALGQARRASWRKPLADALKGEQEPDVRQELQRALAGPGGGSK